MTENDHTIYDMEELKTAADDNSPDEIDAGAADEGSVGETGAAVTDVDSTDESNAHPADERDDEEDKEEEVCFICKRPGSKAGALLRMPNNVPICRECMQKTFDDMGGLPGFLGMGDINFGELFSSGKMPGIHFVNVSELKKSISAEDKKNRKEKKSKPVLDLRKIPAPHRIKERLDEYVVGQEHAKKVMSVAVYNHYKRVIARENEINDGVEIEKSNMLMLGPTGCGKTYLVRTLARLLDVPLAMADATSLTEAGYIGDDIESVLSKLLYAADNDVERAQHGIVFIDEVDKLAKKKNTTQRDVSGESVQQGLLKLLEGSKIEVPVGATSKNAMVPMTTIDTSQILFICGGAFPGLEDVIAARLREHAAIGFRADLKDKYEKEDNLFRHVNTEDIRKFGMIPELIGRLPVVFSLDPLSEDLLVRILKEPKNAILKQYQKLLGMDEVKLDFTDDALHWIAAKAKEKKVGARALRSVIEEFMLDIMFEIPKDDNIGSVTITREYLENKGGPRILMRGCSQLAAQQ